MPTRGFHSEWVTIKDHRILLECRASYPDDTMRFIARVAVETCDRHTGNSARVVKVHYGDKACVWTISIATTVPKEKELEKILDSALYTIFGFGNCQTEVVVVKPGDKGSDHYHHTEHLSIEAEVAVDRFRHDDEEYLETVEDPT